MLARRYLRSRGDERFVSWVGWSSSIGMGIGVAALIVVLSVMNGFDVELKNRILGFSSHVDVQGPGEILDDWQSWLQIADDLPGVEHAGPYVSAQVLANHGSRSTGAMLKGVMPERASLASHVVSGRFIDGKISPFEVVLGKALARKLGAEVGDQIKLLSPAAGVSPSGAAPRMRAFVVVGIFDSGFYEYDAALMLAPLEGVQRLNRLGHGITGIEIYLKDRNQAAQMASYASTRFPTEAWISDWTRRHRSFFEALQMERMVMGVILSLIVVVAAFNMISSLVMVVMQRRKEIAILKTLGATDSSVMRIFLLMGCWLSVMGTIFGSLFGLLLAWKLDAMLAWIEQMLGIHFLSGDVYFIDHLPSIIDPVAVVMIVVMSLCIGVLATLYPAMRATKIPPAEALRYE
ncbi:MAG: lipoprotein-releasing ABC transporter permease subunit [Zetaproteobacteria bacterium]|nr:lipoprotein-releasing ABC transporter permease subunit [Zetaproteobacteria bacterium]